MKTIFPPLSIIILFVVSAFLLVQPLPGLTVLTSGPLLLLNLIVVLAAIYFGTQGVLIFSSVGFLVSLWYSLRMSEFSILPVLLLAATTFISCIYSLKISRLEQRAEAELGNVEEEKNILEGELDHARLEGISLKQKLDKYATLKGLSETLSTTVSFDKATSLITNESLRIVGKSCAGLLYLIDQQKQQLQLVHAEFQSPEYEVKLKKSDIFSNWMLKQRIPLIVEDAKKDFRFNVRGVEEDLRGVRSLICAPLVSQRKLLGILRLDNTAQRAYDSDDLRLLDIISNLSAVTIQNTLFYREMERLAITDGLTGLFVHRYFQERFEQEILRSAWTNSRFTFLMIDIDDFKQYNDKYGHIAGDLVLKKIAKIINSSVNPGDIVARYGGEEFG
ncbi:MAG: diguanylate cyclase, partial [Omnitrophica bacterium]|nr:diguanylate cyclase [Candidatus Omnitrophota bacterium]